MIFVNIAIRQFGEKALIINYKAKEFLKVKNYKKKILIDYFSIFRKWTFIEIFTSNKK
jgi:hypothetical protein